MLETVRVLSEDELPPAHRRMSASRFTSAQGCMWMDTAERVYNIIPRWEKVHFRRGRMIHKIVECYYTGVKYDPESFAPSEREPEQQWADKGEGYYLDLEEAIASADRVIRSLDKLRFKPACMKALGLSETAGPAVESMLQFELRIGSPNLWAWKQRIDLLGTLEGTDELRLLDLKSTRDGASSLGDPLGSMHDPQVGLYSHALALCGVKVERCQILKVRAQAPVKPPITQKGTPSMAMANKTTPALWMQTARENGVKNPEQYEAAVREKFGVIEWIKLYEAHTSPTTSRKMWEDMKNVARTLDSYERVNIRPPRALDGYAQSVCRTMNPAKRCLMAPACLAMLDDLPVPSKLYLPNELQRQPPPGSKESDGEDGEYN